MLTMSRLTVTFLAAVLALPAQAQFRKPEDAIRYRQGVMNTMGNHFYARLGAMANGRIPFDPHLAVENAEVTVMLSKLPWIAFPVGSDGSPAKTKPSVWTEQDKFKELSEKMQAEMAKLLATAKTGNLDNYKLAYRATANTCKSCHDNFATE
jgi:cytochrome c556